MLEVCKLNYTRITIKLYSFTRYFISSSIRLQKQTFRYAPSPTGYSHIGGLRTCFINYLYSQKVQGNFILRIEDTDKERSSIEALEDIFSTLNWFGITPDESPKIGGPHHPYIQSERKFIYKKFIDKLIQSGAAYRCFCSSKRLELLRKQKNDLNEVRGYDNHCRKLNDEQINAKLSKSERFVVRLKFYDDNYGEIVYTNGLNEGDPVLFKSDGMPVYHFANVVDDHLMNVTNVIRGAEWLTSTPKHLSIYNAFGWEPPDFCHLPLLMTSCGKKLSKRSPEFAEVGFIKELRRNGYLPISILRWLAASGGGFRSTYRTMHKLEDFIDNFEPSLIKTENTQIDVDLFNKIAKETIDNEMETNLESLVKQFRAYVQEYHLNDLAQHLPEDDNVLGSQLYKLKGRIRRFSDLCDISSAYRFIWKPVNANDIESVLKTYNTNIIFGFKKFVPEILMKSNNDEELIKSFEKFSKESSLPKPELMSLFRFMITGSRQGLPIRTICNFLDTKEVMKRLDNIFKSY